MKTLTHRERVLMALNHQEPDRVPVDLGGTTATSIFADAYAALKAHLGLALVKPIRFEYPHAEIVRVDEEIVRRFEGGAFPIQLANTNILHYADQGLPDGGYIDEYGVIFERPAGSPYAIVKQAPFDGTPDVAKIVKHRWPSPQDPKRIAGLRQRARHLQKTTDWALVIGLPGRFLSFGQNLCGYANWMTYLATEPNFVDALMDKALEIQAGICAQVLDELGDDVDIAMFADDLGTQQNLQVSPRMYRSVIKPRQRILFDTIKAHTEAKIFLHSDGAIANILPDLIEAGVDIINPVQPMCAGMDTALLKREYGKDISFWGSIDTQRVLPFGAEEEVAAEVKRRVDDLAPGGGFVLAAVHNIQPQVRPENVTTMFDVALKYGQYR